MGTGAGRRATRPAAEQVPFKRLFRTNRHRTSEPTDNEVRSAAWEVARERPGGAAPFIDAVILACVRLATADGKGGRDYSKVKAEVARIEAEVFTIQHPPANDPGE
jgi:hypothetical protein